MNPGQTYGHTVKKIHENSEAKRMIRVAKSLKKISAGDFLKIYSDRGRTIDIYSGLQGHIINDCISAGYGQVFIPAFSGQDFSFVLSDSYNYATHTEQSLFDNLIYGLQQPIEVLDNAVPLYALFTNTFAHWVLESAPKLLALEGYGYDGVYIVPKSEGGSHVEEFFDLFEINRDRIRYNDKRYQVHNLIIPEPMRMRDLINHPDVFFLLRNSIRERVGVLSGVKNAYVKRIGTRRFLNEDDVMDVLRFYDFETMIPEDQTLKDEFRFMTNAGCSLMASGSNMVSSLVQQEKGSLVEICNTRHVNYPHVFIPNLLHLYWFPLCFMPSPDYPSEMHLADDHANIRVNCVVLRTVLENVLGKRQAIPYPLKYLECG
jgi:hypothetical protein